MEWLTRIDGWLRAGFGRGRGGASSEILGVLKGRQPRRVFLRVRGKKIPLLPVFVGLRPTPEHGDVPTWMLYVHPDWPTQVEFDETSGGDAELLIDVVPPGSAVALQVEMRDGVAVIPRHPG